jgi:molybdopterin molybdotransferase
VIALVRQLCRPLETERVSLAQADGRVLREAVCAPEDQPPFDRSSVDGYAVRADDPGDRFRVVDEIRAGEWKPRELRRGEAVRVATGGAIPGAGLQVLMKEEVRAHDGEVQVLQRGSERNIRWRGEDARAGTVLVQAGSRLHAGTMGLLVSLGHVQPLVSRPLRALHLATGNEIVPPEQTLGPGQIRDSNSSLVRAFLAPWRVALHQRRVAEDPSALRLTLASAEVAGAAWDLWLISGGASVGEHDFTRAALADAGFQILVTRTNARPGKPLILAQRGPTIAYGLPGNPLAHFVCLNLYVRAALESWLGVPSPRSFEAGTLGAELNAGGAGRETFWPARWELADGQVRIFPLRWQSSGDLTALAHANALLRLASGAGIVPAGSRVEFWRTNNDA